MQRYIDAYVYAWDLFEVRRRTQALIRKAKNLSDGEMEWVDYWADVSIELDKADKATRVLEETGAFAEDVRRFASALAEATRWDSEDSLAMADVDHWQRVELIERMINAMDDVVDRMNQNCRKEAQDQIRKLAKVIDRIFSHIDATREISAQAESSSERGADVSVREGSAVNRSHANTASRQVERLDKGDPAATVSAAARALLGETRRGAV